MFCRIGNEGRRAVDDEEAGKNIIVKIKRLFKKGTKFDIIYIMK